MEQCVTEQSLMIYRWTFDRMLPSLPGPGTPTFAALARDLQPFGISPSGIMIDAPSPFLSEVNLRISLLEAERATLRMSYGAFELTINLVAEGDDAAFSKILQAVFRAMADLDPDSKAGRAQFTWRGHLTLSQTEVDSFLRQHLHTNDVQDRLTPDLFYYRVRPGANSKASTLRIGTTKSLLFERALFVELVADYNRFEDPEAAGQTFGEDAQEALVQLGLRTQSKGKDTDG